MRSQKGSILYLVTIILSVLIALAYILMDMSRDEARAAQFAYRNEVCMNLAEAVVEEFYVNAQRLMNSDDQGPIGGIYEKLREETREGSEIPIEKGVSDYLVPDSIKLAESIKAAVAIKAAVKDIKQIDINPSGGENNRPGRRIKPDLKEKDAVLEIDVSVAFEDMVKQIRVTRSLKVVNTTMAPLAPFTMFLNDPSWPYLAHWSSKMGVKYAQGRENEDVRSDGRCTDESPTQHSLILDHGWAEALGKTEMSLEDLKTGFEDVLMAGKVPPGRVFVNTGIVPLTNGNMESGMLQRAFYSAETELLPPAMNFTLEDLRGNLSAGAGGASLSDADRLLLEVLEPHNGKLFTRYLGHGAELRHNKVKISGKDRAGYLSYFESYKSAGEWQTDDNSKNPSKSGLDLFGRVELKPEAIRVDRDEEGGIFQRLWDGVTEITRDVLNAFVDQNYNVRVSPTIVYGKALMSYYKVMDYQYTRSEEFQSVWERRKERENEGQSWWSRAWDDIASTFSSLISTFRIGLLGPGQYPIPEFPDSVLEGITDANKKTPFDQSSKSRFVNAEVGWSEETFENFLDLPSGLRTPAFFEYMRDNRKYQQQFFEQNFQDKVPAGAILAPYNNAIGNYLKEFYSDSKLRELFVDVNKGVTKFSRHGIFFDNASDQQLENAWGGQYKSLFTKHLEPEFELANFNPFLYYRKATDYISSIYDYTRRDSEGKPTNLLKEKYLNPDTNRLEMNGVLYITGTAMPLKFSDFVAPGERMLTYKGKAMIVTFGEVIFDVGLKKDGYAFDTGMGAAQGKDDSVLTIVALGGIRFVTEQPIQATVYSFMFPPKSYAEENRNKGYRFQLIGTLGASEIKLEDLPCGGLVKYDPSYFLDNLDEASKNSYYWASLTDEIAKFSWKAGLQ
ncbi:MAG: hypothetical protein H3C47_03105 [Candidatus Cloacimonetes bacterium]|nr:hypothetical protein [Candidatus Cloacimonadota bacterium]